MSKIAFPPQLEFLLKGSPLQPPIRALADKVGTCLLGSNLPFFPDYTDHDAQHINDVLAAQVDLVPDNVWEDRLLNDADAVVIIGATLLHDFAMHLTEKGFLELVSPGSRFKPLPWFKEDHEGHPADRPWPELWDDYARDAKRFSDRKLAQIIGEKEVQGGWKFEKLPENPGEWTKNHRLVIGEFIRRHHARLAHEIAVHGFPGAPVGDGVHEFPAMGQPGHVLKSHTDLIGIVARSHGMSLRVALEALKTCYGRHIPRPMKCAALYAMALLRVGDYLQLDRSRTPAVLLQLKDPQSPISIQEWNKHLAVLGIEDHGNPSARSVRVSEDVPWEIFLQLEELLKGVQQEMDHSTAVLGEEYGYDQSLQKLQLKTRRIESNIHDLNFRKRLPYVPEATGFSSDPNLLSLLVEPLYGKEPGVGVRELMQNSLDAVRELHVWCEHHQINVGSLDLPTLDEEADVLIDFIDNDGKRLLRIQDKGIGMTEKTLQEYFLRAGASFRQSPEWVSEYLKEDGKSDVLRSGRFGVGVFAAFLLGPSLRVWTRNIGAGQGYYLEAQMQSQQIEIKKIDGLKIGTTIEVDISNSAREDFLGSEKMGDEFAFDRSTDWYTLTWPKLIRRRSIAGETTSVKPSHGFDFQNNAPPKWSRINPDGFDSVYWSFDEGPSLTCNGIIVGKPTIYTSPSPKFDWPQGSGLTSPRCAIFDSRGALPLTTQRNALAHRHLPFEGDLLTDVSFSFIAYALICGPESHIEALGGKRMFPLTWKPNFRGGDRPWRLHSSLNFDLEWAATANEFTAFEPWLCGKLGKSSLILFGSTGGAFSPTDSHSLFSENTLESITAAGITKRWCCNLRGYQSSIKLLHRLTARVPRLEVDPIRYRIIASTLESTAEPMTENDSWRDFTQKIVRDRSPSTRRFEFSNWPSSLPDSMIGNLERLLSDTDKYSPNKGCFYAGQWEFDIPAIGPESALEKAWDECLGGSPIPYNPEERTGLIETGRKHPVLKRHIAAWEEMKRNDSRWTRRVWPYVK